MKSLDHRFSADNVATLQHTSLDHRRRQQMDAASYRQKILSTKSGVGSDLRASAGALPVDIRELEGSTFSERSKVVVGVDVSKSPGFKREKQLDRQRRKEKKREEMKEETEDQKSSFLQCTFNMANILMVSDVSWSSTVRKKRFVLLTKKINNPILYLSGSWHARLAICIQICRLGGWILRHTQSMPSHVENLLLHWTRTQW